MGAIMLIEIWERLRGYDKWIPTEAKVESSKVKETLDPESGYIAYSSGDLLVWTDQQGEHQRAYFTVPDDSPLYQLVEGATVTIRYNPADPYQYYLRELLQTRIHMAVSRAIVIFLIVGLFIVVSWLGVRRGSP
jgi:hypothetical protein